MLMVPTKRMKLCDSGHVGLMACCAYAKHTVTVCPVLMGNGLPAGKKVTLYLCNTHKRCIEDLGLRTLPDGLEWSKKYNCVIREHEYKEKQIKIKARRNMPVYRPGRMYQMYLDNTFAISIIVACITMLSPFVFYLGALNTFFGLLISFLALFCLAIIFVR